jgi:hypothetical protein
VARCASVFVAGGTRGAPFAHLLASSAVSALCYSVFNE